MKTSAAFRSAFQWACAGFLCATMVGGLVISVCLRDACLASAPKWVGFFVSGYLWLALPWELGTNGARRSAAPSLASLTAVVIESAGTVGFLIFSLRYSLVRFRTFLAASPPDTFCPANGDEGRPPPAPWVTRLLVATGLAVLFMVTLGKYGLIGENLQRLGVVSLGLIVMICIPLYFEARRSRRPGKLETAMAWGWVAFRRMLLGAFSLLVVLFAVSAFQKGAGWLGAASLLLAAVLARWAWFGMGYRRGFSDDVPQHNARKRRYGWK